ncbi:MAG: hypothetical protein KKE20_02475 [Nanoarchaeota archaeon]|nr:hypothetical protein [Nanoarchaeota archaeon]
MDKQLLGEKEREEWIYFHENAYREDLKLAEKLVIESPRWSIVTGYYAMHDLTKLYLGKIKGWKIAGEFIHSKAIESLSEALKEEPKKEMILNLIKEAEKEIDEALRIHETTVVRLLRAGKSERGKAQYYSDKKEDMFNINFSKKASYFIEKIVKPYIKIMEGMI